MKIVFIILSLFTLAWSKQDLYRIKREPIINGLTIKISRVPYFASIVEKDKDLQKWTPICGASIIADKWLLTAAHCINYAVTFERFDINKTKIRTGMEEYILQPDKEDDTHLHDISNVFPHPNYKHMNIVNLHDIGLIQLQKPIKCRAKMQAPIKLASNLFDLKAGLEVTIIGFGFNTNKAEEQAGTALSSKLLSGKVKVVVQKDCEKIYEQYNIRETDHHFCATSKKYEVAKGDSGGPAVIDSKLIGIINSGGQGKDQYPGLYVDVRKYNDWIKSFVGTDLDQPSSKRCILQ